MADELNKKPNPNPISTPNPAPKQEPKAAPKMNPAPTPKQNPAPAPAPKKSLQANNPFKTGKQIPGFGDMAKPWDKMMGSAQKVVDNNRKNDSTRQTIMKQGFAPKNWDGKSDIKEPSLEQQFKDMKGFAKKQDQGLAKNLEQNPIPVPSKKKFDISARDQFLETIEADNAEEANKIAQQKYGVKYPLDDDMLRADEQMSESKQRSKASEMFGTDLSKKQGYDYDRLSQELDKGDMVNLDAGLLPYDYGYENMSHEDLVVDARKNPETGKYEVFMYPETDLGPVEEPDEDFPDYTFDSFDDLKAFMENNYKEVEKKIEVPELQKLMSDNQKSYMSENENSGQELNDFLSNTKKEDIQNEIEKVFPGDYGKNDRVKTVLNDYLFNNMSVKQMSDKFGVSEGIISRLLGKGLNGLYLKLKNNERARASNMFGTDLNKQQQAPQWDKDNNPGSAVVTKELEDWTRNYLTKQVGKEYADAIASGLARDSKRADFYKGLMKKEFDQKYGGGHKRTEKDLRDFEDTHSFEVKYDYDENGNRNGYELIFKNPEDQTAYEQLLDEVYGGNQ